ncbi:aminodeoxychorismate synthase component I [Neptuniibacter sp. 1_MG-2023]|uniref:aminodeoxychorismate synthase component I n=1 Tax=Neptuniibacter sp. 1_MG-2023 TaxID=3062662 RepID=UPI0026E37832|nr:aminodeoxychorismate synthase component I [Neptuniibacter sp. 1_MG-2023]MDO6592351.1 aminodeoxychorismate synthase component I [Neptuniibacter sp. 1_MG-2023]
MITQSALPYLADSQPYFETIRHLGHAVFLDSGRPKCPWGRYDIIAAAPVETLELNADNKNAFEQLEQLYSKYKTDQKEIENLPFQGGIIGHFSYDLGRSLEKIPSIAEQFSSLPDMRVGMYLWAIVTDHKEQTTQLVADSRVEAEVLQQLNTLLTTKRAEVVSAPETHKFRLKRPFTANLTAPEYKQKLEKVNELIHAGDCYQVNFAQRFDSQFTGDPWLAYKALREVAPTPYSAFIDSESSPILSLSPEQFLESKMQQVTTKPIKGTRPRSNNPEEDQRLKQALRDSVKDRAENLMIVDLLRNDLSKVCTHNSVKAPKLFTIESYANVHHKVSTVTGTLSEEHTPISLLAHCFPGGSITGAPKIRAMEVIEELEPHRRAVYCGSIGYISLCGRMDTSITIRTLLCEENHIYCWAGGGIVADSVKEMEYEETFDKVNNLLHCLEDTML